jgi:ankyrin repeat protein
LISETVVTAFLDAAIHGTVKDLQPFVADHGVDIVNNAKDSIGRTALLWAAYGGHEAKAQWLLKRGANVNATTIQGVSSLMIASDNGHIQMLKMLLEAGATVRHKEEVHHLTALHLAISRSQLDIAELLLDYGADLLVQNIEGVTPLDCTEMEENKERFRQYSPLASLHKQLNASKQQIKQLRQSVENIKLISFVLLLIAVTL